MGTHVSSGPYWGNLMMVKPEDWNALTAKIARLGEMVRLYDENAKQTLLRNVELIEENARLKRENEALVKNNAYLLEDNQNQFNYRWGLEVKVDSLLAQVNSLLAQVEEGQKLRARMGKVYEMVICARDACSNPSDHNLSRLSRAVNEYTDVTTSPKDADKPDDEPTWDKVSIRSDIALLRGKLDGALEMIKQRLDSAEANIASHERLVWNLEKRLHDIDGEDYEEE